MGGCTGVTQQVPQNKAVKTVNNQAKTTNNDKTTLRTSQ